MANRRLPAEADEHGNQWFQGDPPWLWSHLRANRHAWARRAASARRSSRRCVCALGAACGERLEASRLGNVEPAHARPPRDARAQGKPGHSVIPAAVCVLRVSPRRSEPRSPLDLSFGTATQNLRGASDQVAGNARGLCPAPYGAPVGRWGRSSLVGSGIGLRQPALSLDGWMNCRAPGQTKGPAASRHLTASRNVGINLIWEMNMSNTPRCVEKMVGGQCGQRMRAMAAQSERDLGANRLGAALRSSRRAARLLRLSGDEVGEARALSTVAQAAGAMGRDEEAVEAAMLAVHLSKDLPGARLQVKAHIALGLGYLWSHRFERARSALSTAHHAAAVAGLTSLSAQAALGHLWADVLKLAMLRYRGRNAAVLPAPRSRNRHDHGHRHELISTAPTLQASHLKRPAEVVSWRVALALQRCWAKRPEEAERELAAVRPLLGHAEADSPMAALVCWADAELACCRGSLEDAREAATRMSRIALACHHEQLLRIGRLLECHIAELSGRHGDALKDRRNLGRRQLETRVASTGIDNRVLRLRQEVARAKAVIRAMKADLGVHERNSLVDCLTGLKNRRAIDQTLQRALAHRSDVHGPLSLALIDVDRFKLINDLFTHHVGDLALKAVARVLSHCIREQDLAFRLAGDEFVIVLADADQQASLLVCDRIAQGMQDFDWPSIGISFPVSLTSGVAQAETGDSVETLISRADRDMYIRKTPCAASQVELAGIDDPQSTTSALHWRIRSVEKKQD